MKFAIFLRTSFLQNSLSSYLLDLGVKGVQNKKSVRLPAIINTTFRRKKVFAAAKIQKQPPLLFCKRRPETLLLERCSSIAKLLRTSILKNICERLLLKISISVTNSEEVVQSFLLKKFSDFAKFRESLFLIKLQAWDSSTGVFLWILGNF